MVAPSKSWKSYVETRNYAKSLLDERVLSLYLKANCVVLGLKQHKKHTVAGKWIVSGNATQMDCLWQCNSVVSLVGCMQSHKICFLDIWFYYLYLLSYMANSHLILLIHALISLEYIVQVQILHFKQQTVPDL